MEGDSTQTLTTAPEVASEAVRSEAPITPPQAPVVTPAAPTPSSVAKVMQYDDLSIRDRAIIDYVAMGGVDVAQDGSFRSLNVQEFAHRIGYADRRSIYDRQEALSTQYSNYHEVVKERQVYLQKTVGVLAVWKGLFLRGAKGDARQAELFLANHDPDFIMPAQKIEHEAGNSWSRLLDKARQRAEDVTNVEEGQIVNG